MVASFSCAYLPGKVPMQGRLVLTHDFLCFTTLAITNVFGHSKIVVELAHVELVTKAATAWGLVANSLVVRLKPLPPAKREMELFFTSFFHRDKCYQRITELVAQAKEIEKNKISSGSWVTLDPRLESAYTGESSVETTEDLKHKKRNSGFLQFEDAALELLEGEGGGKREGLGGGDDNDQVEKGEDSKTKNSSCGKCGKDNATRPCNCYHDPPDQADKGVRVPRENHTLLGSSYWKGGLRKNVPILFLGVDPEEPLASNNGEKDLAQMLGAHLGDEDGHWTAFAKTDSPACCWESYQPRPKFAPPKPIHEHHQSENDSVLSRIVSFSKPLGNTMLGKQVANTTQLQRIWGCKVNEDGSARFDADTRRVELHNDTSLAGFPYSDCFVVRTSWIMTELRTPEDAEPRWCRLDCSVRIVWLKSVRVPMLKGTIEKENVQTGKKNLSAWMTLAHKRLPDQATASATSAAAQPSQNEEIGEGEGRPDSSFSAPLAFFTSAWDGASETQRLQIVLLCTIILLQVWTVLFK